MENAVKVQLPKCDPREIALKSFFLGPQAENAPWVSRLLGDVFQHWVGWRRSLFPQDGSAISESDQNSPEFKDRRKRFEEISLELLTRFENEVPKFSPRYVGHMFSEVSLPALIGHIVTLLHNPNNISGESSRVGIKIEDEAVHALLSMVGFSGDQGTGHFTSGGTVANLEALIRAQARASLWLSAEASLKNKNGKRAFDPVFASHSGWKKFNESLSENQALAIDSDEMAKWNLSLSNPIELSRKIEELSGKIFLGPVILVPENKHYSWKKGCQMMGLGRDSLWSIALDSKGRLSVEHLKKLLSLAFAQGRPVLLVVSVLGTTELGGIDPIHEVQDVLDSWERQSGVHIWHHVDAAFGGLFRTLDLDRSQALSEEGLRSLSAVPRVNSITIDPHKLGYVPYASGTFLVRDQRDYYFSTFDDAPYIDFDQNLDRGPYTIEGSRSAAGAVATWMTAKTIGLNPEGYGLLLERTTRICKELVSQIEKAELAVQIAPGCDTNIVCFTCAKPLESISSSNQRTLKVFEAFSPKTNGAFIVSKTTLRWKSYPAHLDAWISKWEGKRDTDEVVLIRMCMMNPFFGSKETDIDYLEAFTHALRKQLAACELNV